MTWVFGTATSFGSAVCVADIQVTLSDGRTFDCLQKVHPITSNVLMGFAGDVETGFEMIALFRALLRDEAEINDALMSEGKPTRGGALERFTHEAQQLFMSRSAERQRNGCELMLAVAYPSETHVYGSKPEVSIFRGPSFERDVLPIGSWGVIGSGADIPHYQAEIDKMLDPEARSLLNMEAGNPGGYPRIMAQIIVMQVWDMPPEEGVSKHFHVGVVLAHGFAISTSDRTTYAVGPPVEIRMPPVATSWGELQALLRASEVTSGAAAHPRAS